MAITENVTGQTSFGNRHQNNCLVQVVTKSGTASGLVLVSSDGTEVVIWARNDGKLYGGTRANFASPESAGTALW